MAEYGSIKLTSDSFLPQHDVKMLLVSTLNSRKCHSLQTTHTRHVSDAQLEVAAFRLTPYMPRLDTVNAPPWNLCSWSLPNLAHSASS